LTKLVSSIATIPASSSRCSTTIKFRARCVSWTAAESQLATLYSEFAEEDQRLAEEGLDEYAEILDKEDLQ
jgi:hypothetical protein